MKTKTRPKSFNGISVGALETRMQEEMIQLIKNLDGQPFVVPSVREVSLQESESVLDFGKKLMAGQIDFVILMTGVGTRRLIQTLTTKHKIEDICEQFKKLIIVVRGPKPVKVLTEFGLEPTIRVPEPNTWREILKTLDAKTDIKGKTVVVQEHGEPNKLFLAELAAREAHVIPIFVYRAELPVDTKPLKDLIQKILQNKIDVLLFTNATQVSNLFGLARTNGNAQELRRCLTRVIVASVGPSCSDALRSHGVDIDLEPARPMMGALVAEAAAQSSTLLEKKKKSEVKLEVQPRSIPKPGDELHQSLFLKACRKEPVERTPVWLMRQAGRYMKEYRELRAKVSFLDLCKNSDLASEVTVDAAHRLGVDAGIIFSDILIVLEPMGFDLAYLKNEGPEIGNPFREKKDLERIRPVDVMDSLRYVFDAIRKTRASLKPNIPLIGFVGAPFTLASYLIEGKSSRQFVTTKRLMYEDPETWHALLTKISDCLIPFLNEQIKAGAQAVQIFDSWAGCLAPEDYRKFVLPHTQRVIQGITPGVPVISFGTQTNGLLPILKQAGGDVIGVDWRIELDEAWDMLGDVAIMGNLDPVVLYSNPKEIRQRTQRILNQAAGRPGHIFNLGHGVLPQTPIENVLSLVETVKELSRR